MDFARRRFLQLAAGAAALPAVSPMARAQSYPTRPVRWLVGYPAGGSADIVARLVGQHLADKFGQPFVIENRPGAGNNIATEAAVRAPADGYTLLLVNPANAINATLYDKLNFDFLQDMAPVAGVMRVPNVAVVHPSIPAKDDSRVHCLRQGQPWQDQHGVERQRSALACGRRVVQDDGRHRHGSRALSRIGTCTDRPARRAGADHVRPIAVVNRAHPCGQAAAAGGDHDDSFRSDCRTSRLWVISCRATRRAPGSASAYPGTRPRRSSTSSTMKSTRPWPIPNSRRASPIWAAPCLRDRRPIFGKLVAAETEKWAKVVRFSGAKPA